jgi:hypothetical protein
MSTLGEKNWLKESGARSDAPAVMLSTEAAGVDSRPNSRRRSAVYRECPINCPPSGGLGLFADWVPGVSNSADNDFAQPGRYRNAKPNSKIIDANQKPASRRHRRGLKRRPACGSKRDGVYDTKNILRYKWRKTTDGATSQCLAPIWKATTRRPIGLERTAREPQLALLAYQAPIRPGLTIVSANVNSRSFPEVTQKSLTPFEDIMSDSYLGYTICLLGAAIVPLHTTNDLA